MLGLQTSLSRTGLTLEHSGLRYVKLKKRKKWEVESKGYLPLPEGVFQDDQLVDIELLRGPLLQWASEQQLKGSSVYLSIPTSQIIIRRMKIQSTNPKDYRQLVALEVETTLHLPFEDPVYDFVATGVEDESTQLLVFAVSKQIVQAYAELFQSAGIRVLGIELSATALARAIQKDNDKLSFDETMLINLDRKVLEIYMFHEGHPVFVRTINLYGQSDEENSGLTAAQLSEVTAEISRMLNFYQFSIHEGNARIAEALITGFPEGRNQLLAELPQSLTEMKIGIAEFEAYAAIPEDGADLDPYCIPIGLALRENDKENINLMVVQDRQSRLRPYLIGAALLVWVLCAVGIGYMYMDNQSTAADNEKEIQRLNEQIVLLEQGLAAQKGNSGSQSNPLEIIESIQVHRRDAVAVLNELNAKLPKGAIIRTTSYNNPEQIGLNIVFQNANDASKYLFDLRRMSFVAGAQLQSVSKETIGDTSGISSADGTTTNVPSVIVQIHSAAYAVQFKKPEGA